MSITKIDSIVESDSVQSLGHDGDYAYSARMNRSRSVESSSQRLSLDVVGFDELSKADLAQWERLRASNPIFRTPFFSARYSAAVQVALGDVQVALVSRSNDVVGILPFHRQGKIAYPVGQHFNDAHQIICDPESEIRWNWLINKLGLTAYDFHALVDDGIPTDNCVDQLGEIRSFAADFLGDSQAFLDKLAKNHVAIKRQPQKTRKLGREIGPVRLELDCRDPHTLESLVSLKRDQYRRTRIKDLFAPDWTRKLVHSFHTNELEGIPGEARGLLSVLWAGDQMVAGHYGILEHDLLHYWFPVYDIQFARYSPGTALFTDIVRQATKNGIDCIDMGYGEQPYKLRQTDTITKVSYGTISSSSLHKRRRRVETATMDLLKRMPMKEAFKACRRYLLPNFG